jgi:hypothetical protein
MSSILSFLRAAHNVSFNKRGRIPESTKFVDPEPRLNEFNGGLKGFVKTMPLAVMEHSARIKP